MENNNSKLLIGLALLAGGALFGYVAATWKSASPPATQEIAAVTAAAETPAPAIEPSPSPSSGGPAPAAPRKFNAGKPSPMRPPASESKPAPATNPTPESKPTPVAEPPAPAPVAAAPEPKPVLNPPPGTKTEEPKPAPRKARTVTLTEGTLINVSLGETLTSKTHKAGDSFAATLSEPIVADGFVIAEKGARVEGRVVEATESGRIRGRASLAVELVQVSGADGQKIKLQTTPFAKEAEKTTKEDAKKVGIGAAVGAAVGAIAGGGKGAAIGAAAGGGAGTGAVLATRGDPAVLNVETRLTFRLSQALTVTEKI